MQKLLKNKWLNPPFCCIISRNVKKEVALFFTSLGVVALLVAGIGELALRIRYGTTALPRELGSGYPAHLVMPDERMGYTLTPGFRGRQLVPGQPDVELKINRLGLRDDERELPSSAQLIVVLGDSFAFGHGVPFEEIWPTLLEKKIRLGAPRYEVLKAGVPGFGWRQYYQQYKRLTPPLNRHSLVIVGFTVDAGERITKGYAARGGILVKRNYPNLVVLDGLVYEKASRHVGVNQVDAFLRSHSYFFRWFNQRLTFLYHRRLKKAIRELLSGSEPEEKSHRAEQSRPIPTPSLSEQRHIRHAIAVLDAISELAKTKGAKMLVLFVNEPNKWADEVAYYEAALSQKGIPTLDPSKYEAASPSNWRLPKDGHWNAYANREVAEIVYQFIREKKLLESVG
jgi:hypothetical protein